MALVGAAGRLGWRHPHYAALLETRPALDCVEVHSENFLCAGGAALQVLMEARAHYPVSLHGVGLALGSAAGVDAWHLDQLAALVERIDPVRVSDHACFARAPLAGQMAHASDLLPIPFHRAALDVLCSNVQQVQDRLRRPLLVENLSAYIGWASSEMAEPDFLLALARRTGCQLLVDVNNLYVNALNAQLQGRRGDPLRHATNWLDQLPAGVVGEIHLAGHVADARMGERLLIDTHGAEIAEPVWRLYEQFVRRIGPRPTLIERDENIPTFKALMQERTRAAHILMRVASGQRKAALDA